MGTSTRHAGPYTSMCDSGSRLAAVAGGNSARLIDPLGRQFFFSSSASITRMPLEDMFATLTAAGTRVVTLTVPDVGKVVSLARPLSPRVFELNARIRAAAARHGVAVAETGRQAVATDPRMWAPDRLHASSLGHERIAAAVAHALRLPGSDDAWTLPLPPQAIPRGWKAAGAELRWATAFLGPWLGRRLRGQSSGDGRTAKRPRLLPLSAGPDSAGADGSTSSPGGAGVMEGQCAGRG